MRLRNLIFAVVLAIAMLVLAAAASRMYHHHRAGDLFVRVDPRFDQVLSPDAKLEKLAEGFLFPEGPAWNKAGAYLLFSDMPANAIYKWEPSKGISLYLKPSGYSGSEPFRGANPGSNGLAFDSAGRLVICEHGNRRITRLEPDGSRTVLVDRFQGRRLNSPNDLAFNSRGDLYFTDPPYGLPAGFDDPDKELAFSGVYRLSATGELTLLARDAVGPNGIAFSPSENELYVSDSFGADPGWLVYDVTGDGSLANGRRFLTTPAWAKALSGTRDGIKVDRSGHIFASGPGGIHVFAPDGAHLGSIKVQDATNLAWGDDGSMLYITGKGTLYRVRTLTRAHGF
jgi:gluconolactonase